jgi:hypothetical protein
MPTAIKASPKPPGGELRAIPQGRTPESGSPGSRPASLAGGPPSIPASGDPPSLALAAPTTSRLPATSTPDTMRLRQFVMTEDAATVVPAETPRLSAAAVPGYDMSVAPQQVRGLAVAAGAPARYD